MLLLLLMATGVTAEDYRLPLTVVPHHYSIKLVPYFQERNFTFDGHVVITVTAISNSDNITLHYDSVEILETPSVISSDNLHALEVVETSYDNETNFYTLWLNDSLRSDEEYLIRIEYTGDLDQDMSGFYKSSYNTSNQTRWLAVTQFEPTYARKAFPCFDEPSLKARFQVNIARTADYHSISNTPLQNTSRPDPRIGGRVWDSFKETPLMSTYLVAFVVSDLKNLTTQDGKYSVWMREEVLSQGKFALSVAPTIIEALEQYTEIKYELSKLDQVYIPDMFFWAMENWGLVTLWEGHVTELEEKETLLVVAHEFAHLWFGDLVSPKWWNYLWLNEGFATFFEYKISSQIEPEWELDKKFLVDMHQTALAEDCYNSSHPITHSVSTPKEINKIFDAISYDKAGSVIRSMEHFLTPHTLRRGLSKYLKQHSHDVAEADDLFHILDQQQKLDAILPRDMDVKTIMDSWTLQAGYPVIHVTRVKDGIQLTQERFLLKEQNDSRNESLWWVPLSYTTSADMNFTDTRPRVWLRAVPQLMVDTNISESEWIMLNLQATGFYRVNYDLLTWSHIIKQMRSLEHRDIHVLNRAQLLDDAFSLARAGILNYTTALDLSTYLEDEVSATPWESFINSIRVLDRRLYGSASYTNFKKYGIALIGKLYAAKGSDHMKTIVPVVRDWVCSLDQDECVAKAIELFSEWMSKPDDKDIFPKEYKTLLYCTAVRNNRKMWDYLWKQFQAESDNDEQWNQYYALACTEEPVLLKRYLNMSLSEDVEKYTFTSIVYNVLQNSQRGVEATLDFLMDNMPQVLEKMEDKELIEDIVSMVAGEVTTHQQADKLVKLVEENDIDVDPDELVEEDMDWMERHYDAVAKWLSDFVNNRT